MVNAAQHQGGGGTSQQNRDSRAEEIAVPHRSSRKSSKWRKLQCMPRQMRLQSSLPDQV